MLSFFCIGLIISSTFTLILKPPLLSDTAVDNITYTPFFTDRTAKCVVPYSDENKIFVSSAAFEYMLKRLMLSGNSLSFSIVLKPVSMYVNMARLHMGRRPSYILNFGSSGVGSD